MHPMPDRRSPRLSRSLSRGFTLVELLIVIGVIGILVGIVMSVGVKVSSSGKVRLTEDAIKSLGMALTQFESTEGTNLVPSTVQFTDPSNSRLKVFHPVADAMAWKGGDGAMLDSVALFIKQLDNRSPEARSVVNGMSSKLIKVHAIHEEAKLVTWDEPHQPLVTVFDAWGNPIRYVHPAFDGNIYGGPTYPKSGSTGAPVPLDANSTNGKNPFGLPIRTNPDFYGTDKIRRYSGEATGKVSNASPDADGGICPNNKPYFYSVGPDGLVGYGQNGEDYNADNVYLVQPTFQDKDK